MLVQRRKNYERSNLDELKSLAEAADYNVVGHVEQLRRPDAGFQIGKGKAGELAELVDEVNAERVIFDNELKPIQSYNLAKVVGVEIIDRFQLILEIFSKRASTNEAHLQIRLARLRHQLPRAREMVRLARMGERPGFLGLGTFEVDVYNEEIKRQIHSIRRELKKIRVQRGLHRVRRTELGFPLISLAGYTSAGKTTLFNFLTGAAKSVNLGIFTTLTTTTRAVDLDVGRVLVTDTVGFIDRLPLTLVEAFHSTLEETILSDAIILLVDFHESLDEIQRKLSYSLEVLNEIGAGGIPTVTALNKIDLLTENELEERFDRVEELAPNPILISAVKGTNLEELKRLVSSEIGDVSTTVFSLPLTEESLSFISELHSQVNSVETVYNNEEVVIKVTAFRWLIEGIEGKVKRLHGKLAS
ncbi:MAG: GTPase HflX [Candidatus Bathyarchaeota archaeon]|nr:GTPase HflX [Candidatus Bathyarchaeota archaeon]